MTDGWLCDRCETFHTDENKSTFTSTVKATGARLGMGEESTWDLCANCATKAINELDLQTASDRRGPVEAVGVEEADQC